MKRTKGALIAGTAVLAMAGVGGGIAFAADSTPTTTAPTTSGPSSATSAPAAHQHRASGRVEHGQLTVRTKSGDQVLDIQHGQVTSISATSVTVRSTDGFTATYGISSTSTVRVQQKASTIANVHTGDQVAVAALHSGGTDTVRRISDAGPAK